MSGKKFVIAQGDKLPPLKLEAVDASGVPVNLSGATSVSAYMLLLPSGHRVTLAATISNAAAGEITITWGDGDTSAPGRYRLWVVVTFAGGPMTFPSCPDGNDAVIVEVCPG